MTALSMAAPGAFYTVKWNLLGNIGRKLDTEYGLTPGNDIFLVNNYWGNVIVRTDKKQFALNKEIAQRIKV